MTRVLWLLITSFSVSAVTKSAFLNATHIMHNTFSISDLLFSLLFKTLACDQGKRTKTIKALLPRYKEMYSNRCFGYWVFSDQVMWSYKYEDNSNIMCVCVCVCAFVCVRFVWFVIRDTWCVCIHVICDLWYVMCVYIRVCVHEMCGWGKASSLLAVAAEESSYRRHKRVPQRASLGVSPLSVKRLV